MFMSFLYFFFRATSKLMLCNVDISPLEAETPNASSRRVCAAIIETLLKVFAFFGWLAAACAMVYIAVYFNRCVRVRPCACAW